jgi:hypothetical protein
MPNKIAFISGNFGNVDNTKPLPRHDGIDSILFTDRVRMLGTRSADLRTWGNMIVNPVAGQHDEPWMRSRFFKQQWHKLPEMDGYEFVVWADSSLQFNDMEFITEFCEAMPEGEHALFVPHPDRTTVEEEYEHVSCMIANGDPYLSERYNVTDMGMQLLSLETAGMNCADTRLWCAGFYIVRNTPLIHKCFDLWWHYTQMYGRMDQLSLSAAFEFNGVHITPINVNIYRNQWWSWRKGT